jgi:hypothetical protein
MLPKSWQLKILDCETSSNTDSLPWDLPSIQFNSIMQPICPQIPGSKWSHFIGQTSDIGAVIYAGVRILVALRGPVEWPYQLRHDRIIRSEQCGRSMVSDIFRNDIRPSIISFMSACVLNSQLLGIDPLALTDDDAESPFLQLNQSRLNDSTASSEHSDGTVELSARIKLQTQLPAIYFGQIKPELIPTIAQVTIPHHPYIDVLPWPIFRSNVIIASSMNPPQIDEEDLCLDLMNNGLRCWGPATGSLHGRGEGTPWDSRSWEVMSWFQEKWGHLAGGKGGNM